MNDPSREAFERYAKEGPLGKLNPDTAMYQALMACAEGAWQAAVAWATQREQERCVQLTAQTKETLLKDMTVPTVARGYVEAYKSRLVAAIYATLRAETEGK